MRIVSGKNRGRKLYTLPGMNTRPTADRTKEAVFNILFNDPMDANVLDLFAGSGALGLECISRGANRCVFVDNSKDAAKIIKQNIELCKAEDKSEIRNTDYKVAIETSVQKKELFDLIFVDPPYSKDIARDVLHLLECVLTEKGKIIVETDHTDEIEEKVGTLCRYDMRQYGRTVISFFKREG